MNAHTTIANLIAGATGTRPAIDMNGVTHPARRASYSAFVDASLAERNRNYLGHAGEGGLQQHSVAGNYPWHVVGYGDRTFGVTNLATGESLRARFRNYDDAGEWADNFAGGCAFEPIDDTLGEGTFGEAN